MEKKYTRAVRLIPLQRWECQVNSRFAETERERVERAGKRKIVVTNNVRGVMGKWQITRWITGRERELGLCLSLEQR